MIEEFLLFGRSPGSKKTDIAGKLTILDDDYIFLMKGENEPYENYQGVITDNAERRTMMMIEWPVKKDTRLRMYFIEKEKTGKEPEGYERHLGKYTAWFFDDVRIADHVESLDDLLLEDLLTAGIEYEPEQANELVVEIDPYM